MLTPDLIIHMNLQMKEVPIQLRLHPGTKFQVEVSVVTSKGLQGTYRGEWMSTLSGEFRSGSWLGRHLKGRERGD